MWKKGKTNRKCKWIQRKGICSMWGNKSKYKWVGFSKNVLEPREATLNYKCMRCYRTETVGRQSPITQMHTYKFFLRPGHFLMLWEALVCGVFICHLCRSIRRKIITFCPGKVHFDSGGKSNTFLVNVRRTQSRYTARWNFTGQAYSEWSERTWKTSV